MASAPIIRDLSATRQCVLCYGRCDTLGILHGRSEYGSMARKLVKHERRQS